MMSFRVLHGRGELLRVHGSAQLTRARATDVGNVGGWREMRLPPGAIQSIAQIHLFVVHEERAVESADGSKRRRPQRERRPRDPWNDARALVRVACEIELPQSGNLPDERADPRIIEQRDERRWKLMQ